VLLFPENKICPILCHESYMPHTDQVNQIILVALSDLQDPDWNPRPFLDEVEMQSLVDFIQAGGHIPPITLLKGSDQAPWDVISGKRRREAARRAGKIYIEAIKLDITLEEAKILAIAANRDNKPYWLGEFIAVKNLKLDNNSLNQKELAQKLGWTEFRVSTAINLMELLNPVTRELILQIASGKIRTPNSSGDQKTQTPSKKKPWRLAEDAAIRLIPLLDGKPLEEAQALTQKAVEIMLNRQFTGPQTDELVNHVFAGGDLDQFSPAAKVKKARKAKNPETNPQLATQNNPATQEVPPPNTSVSQDSVTLLVLIKTKSHIPTAAIAVSNPPPTSTVSPYAKASGDGHKTDVGDDILKAAPAGIGAAKKLFGL
jgi:ParB/RepB/Spo0J family partition protein